MGDTDPSSDDAPPAPPTPEPPAPSSPGAVPPPPAPAPAPAPVAGTAGNNDLLTAIRALPEQVANAVREATTTASVNPKSPQKTTEEVPPGKTKPGRSFVERWFGTNK